MFRTFEQLRLDGLGDVNLLVGRNNVGKTMALEALRLYAAQGRPETIWELLVEREEFERGSEQAARRAPPVHLNALFHGRPQMFDQGPEIVLGPPDEAMPRLCLRLGYVRPSPGGSSLAFEASGKPSSGTPGLEILYAGEQRAILPFDNDHRWYFFVPSNTGRHLSTAGATAGATVGRSDMAFVPAHGVHNGTMVDWWDAISLTEAEHRIVECLQIVSPVERIALVKHPIHEADRVVMVKLRGEPDPVPLRSLGDGLERMFWIALAMERARERGILLIDEIENGIHYTALPGLWTFIAKAAARNHVQVFATSHSWDCVVGFQEAMCRDSESRGVLIRLRRTASGIEPTAFSEAELQIATRDRIEVR